MRQNHQRIASLLKQYDGKALRAHYLGYFACFNRQLYFEAHEVLEPLWLEERGRPNELFYKGLIQFAGAFVHLQKNRPGPAVALFGLARQNLKRYPDFYQQLDVKGVCEMIDQFLLHLATQNESPRQFSVGQRPKLFPIGFELEVLGDLF